MNEDVEQARKLAFVAEKEYCQAIKEDNGDVNQHSTSSDLLGALEKYLSSKGMTMEEVPFNETAVEYVYVDEPEASISNPEEIIKEVQEDGTKSQTHSKISFIVEELISTEVEYLNSLHFLVVNYLGPICNGLTSTERSKIAQKMCNYIKMIHRLGTNFLDDLIQVDTDFIGDVFLHHRSLFNIYAKLSRVWNSFMKLVHEPQVDLFIKKLEVDLREAMGFGMYMLKPMQRLGKYELLLNQIHRNVSGIVADDSGLANAKDFVKNILKRCNTIVALASIDYNVHDEDQAGFYIMKTDLKWKVNRRKKKMVLPVELFIFEHVVILTVDVQGVLEYRDSILLSNLSRVDHDDPLRITLEDVKDSKQRRSIKLEAPNPSAKQKCLQSIDDLLWCQLKNMKKQQASN